MKKLLLLAPLMLLILGLWAVPAAGSKDIIEPTETEVPAPYELSAEIVNTDDVLLYWTNPVYTDVPLGFRIYCNGNMVRYISGANISDYILETVCAGCHEFWVTAYFDSDTETPPSNVVLLTMTPNSDYNAASEAMILKAYPNPSRSAVNLSLPAAKANADTRLTIFNVKGQSVKTMIMRGKSTWNWDHTDDAGDLVPAGIYYARAESGAQSTTAKLLLTR